MTKSKIPYLIFGAIALLMLIDFAFMYLAKKSYTGVYTENAYQKGINFDKIYRSGLYDKSNGWKSKIEVNLLDNQVLFMLEDGQGRPIEAEEIEAKIIRPVTNKFDRDLALKQVAPGKYEGHLELLTAGVWEVRIKAIYDHKEYVSSKRFER